MEGSAIKFKTVEAISERYRDLVDQLIGWGIIVADYGELEYPLSPDMLYLLKLMQRMN